MTSLASRPLLSATAFSRQQPNHAWLAQIIRAQREGRSCLPFHLGLDARDHGALIQAHFPEWSGQTSAAQGLLAHECNELREELLDMRRDEWEELRALLLDGRRGSDPDEVRMANIVAAACLGGDHLWRDLGLDSRLHLRELLGHNFPRLAMRNVRDMRWKKFFYKQLCERDGGYVCRAPSCQDCPTYHDCFGEEL